MLNTQEIASAVARGNMIMVRGPMGTIGKSVDDFLKSLQEVGAAKKNTTRADREAWLRANYNTQELASAVTTNINNDVLAHMWALGMFQLVTLADNEQPVLQTVNRDGTFKVWTIGESGGRARHQFIDRRTYASHLLRQIASPEVGYQMFDLQTGNVTELDRIQSEMSYELQRAKDGKAKTLIDAAITTAGSGLRATLNLHKSIVAANIPDSNYLDLNAASYGPQGKWSIEKVKVVMDYFERFASDVETDGTPLAISTIFASTVNRRDFWDFASLVSGWDSESDGFAPWDPKSTVPASVKEEIYRTGKLTNAFGNPINILTRNTLASGYAYVSSNKPMGIWWEKPGMAFTGRKEDRPNNQGSMSTSQVYGAVIPDAWKYRGVYVKL